MSGGSPSSWLRRKLDIRPGEGGVVAGLFAYFFVIMAAGYIILPLKISRFLKDMDLRILPVVLLRDGRGHELRRFGQLPLSPEAPAAAVHPGQSALLHRRAGSCSGGSKAWRPDPSPFPSVFWFWAEMFLAVSVIQFWILVNESFTPAPGQAVHRPLHRRRPARRDCRLGPDPRRSGRGRFICCAPGFLAAAFAVVLGLPVSRRDEEPGGPAARPAKRTVGYLESLRTLLKNRYLVLMSGLMLAAFGASGIISFQFNFFLKHRSRRANRRRTMWPRST